MPVRAKIELLSKIELFSFLDQNRICKFQKLLQFFQFIESCHSEITFKSAAFDICSIQDNQYFVEVKIKG